MYTVSDNISARQLESRPAGFVPESRNQSDQNGMGYDGKCRVRPLNHYFTQKIRKLGAKSSN